MTGHWNRRVAGLLLAAGGGSRLGRPKALVEFDGQLLIDRTVDLMAAAKLDPCVVVLGAAAEEVRAAADLTRVVVVDNPDWENGMAGSLRAGLTALTGRADAVVVLLVDQPLIGAEAIERLVAAWQDGAPAAVATYEGEPRNPALFDVALWPTITRSTTGDVGARSFLRSHPDVVAYVPCDDTGAPDDIDTKEDLARVERRHP